MVESHQSIPDWLLERVALGEVPPEQMRDLQARLDADPEARSRLERIRDSNSAVLDQYPVKKMGRFIAAKRILESAADEQPTKTPPALPPRVLRHAARRLWAVSTVIGAFFCVGLVAHTLLPHFFGWSGKAIYVALSMDATVILASIALLAAVRSRKFEPGVLLRAGQVYEVVVCFSVSLFEAALYHDPSAPPVGLSFVCVLIVIFPIFVTSTPQSAMIVSLLAACTGPAAAIVFAWSTGAPEPLISYIGGRYVFNFITVLLAGVPIAMMRRHGHEVSRAERLGSYKLEELLGRGGMGEVYRASHHTLRRPAAIKLIRPESIGASDVDGGRTALQRFEREAQATSELHSPHTIQLYDFGTAADGRFFYVMELLDGFDIESLVTRFGPQPATRVVHILAQACESLSDAHRSGLIHRDIKPANIYLCRYGHDLDFVKVLDFGMVKMSETPDGDDVRLTRANAVAGTPAYLAPEMVLGESEVDGRADLYALGCVGYWLLTGLLVFEADTPMKMALAHVREDPPLPSERSEIEIPTQLEQVIMSCLAKEPDERPATARALADALRQSLNGERWSEEDAQNWWQRNSPTSTIS